MTSDAGQRREDSDAYYVQVGPGRYRPTVHAQGAWSEHEQHMAVVAGLITHEVESFEPRPDLQLAKIGFEILGFLPLDETVIEVRCARPGRTIEQLEFVATIGGRAVVRGTAWRLLRVDTSAVAGCHEALMPAPERLPACDLSSWTGGYIESITLRRDEGEPGRNRGWLRSDLPLVLGHESSSYANFVRFVDTANGIAVRANPTEWLFPNVDLVVHLWREPDPTWVGLDTTVAFGASGVGLTSSVLHDLHGPVGRAEQVLTVRQAPLP